MVDFNPRNISLFVAQGCWERLHRFEGLGESNTHTPGELFAMIKAYLNKYNTKNFEWIDYCNADLEDLKAFCSLIIKNKLEFKWSAPAIMNPKMDREIINSMAKSGCRKLFFEIFSLPQSLLKKMKIMFDPEAASRILKLCYQEGISVGINLFFGHPQEASEDFENTINFLKTNIAFISEITRVTYCPSSYIYSNSLGIPLCRYWVQCLSLNKSHVAGFSKIRFLDCISKILNLSKPIVKIEPNEIILNDLLNYHIDQVTLPPHSISRGRIKVAYSEGGLQFFWNNIRITANVGLNIALNTLGLWIDSTKGDWQILEMTEGYLKVRTFFGNLPVSQIWEIKITGEYKISYKIDIEIEKRLRIEEIRMVCLVDPRYLRWFNDYQEAEFPRLDNQWHDLWQEELPISRLGVRSVTEHTLPLFVLEVKNKGIFSLIQNPPERIKSRIIGFKNKISAERKDYLPGRYDFIEGGINFFAVV